MIERIEQLREAEGILRQHREFQRPDDLFDHFVEPRRLEHKRPQVACIGGQFVGKSFRWDAACQAVTDRRSERLE